MSNCFLSTFLHFSCFFCSTYTVSTVSTEAGADLGGHQARAPPPPIFTCKIFLESYICPYDNTYSSHIFLKCLMCVCITVKIQFDNSIPYEYSSYSPSARSLCSITHLGPPFRNSGSAPVKYVDVCLMCPNCFVPLLGHTSLSSCNIVMSFWFIYCYFSLSYCLKLSGLY